MRKRSKARELALQSLYQLEIRKGENIPETVWFPDEADLPVPESRQTGVANSTRQFAHELIEGVTAKGAELDRLISEATQHWKLPRMAIVDRLILRLGCYEILFCPETPPAVVINEAVELAKRFSTGVSGAFVNGILDYIARSKVS